MSRLEIGPPRLDDQASLGLQTTKLYAKNRGDLSSAVVSAGYYAKKTGKPMFVYFGNSYGHHVWRVAGKASEYLDPINNTGESMLSVSPDLVVSWHDLQREAANRAGGHVVVSERGEVVARARTSQAAHRTTRRANMAGSRVAPMLTPDEYATLDNVAKYGPSDMSSLGGEKISLSASGLVAPIAELEGRLLYAVTPVGMRALKAARSHYGGSGDDLMVAIAERRFGGGKIVRRR